MKMLSKASGRPVALLVSILTARPGDHSRALTELGREPRLLFGIWFTSVIDQAVATEDEKQDV